MLWDGPTPEGRVIDSHEPAFAARLVALRRDLHRHPELGGRETRTAARVADVLRSLGVAHRVGVGGAGALIADGALDGVGAIFGGHIDRTHPAGTLTVPEGAVNASTDSFRITVTGRGGHAARPHECTDALVAASFVVTALQTIVARQ